MKQCSIIDCKKEIRKRGTLCSMHAWRKWKHGDPSIVIRPQHGKTFTPEWHVWNNMISRCHIPTTPNYKDYGGRGIMVCSEWRSDFQAFLDYIGLRPSPKHSIERINNNEGYRPGNVRWATIKEQSMNKRSTVYLTINGVTKTMVEWSKETGLSRGALDYRRKAGKKDEELIKPII